MFYEFPLTIPQNTLATALVSTTCRLDYGIVSHVEIQFPSGCGGLVHVRVRERAHQLYPTNDGSYHTSDGHVIAFGENYQLVSVPYIWYFEGYNEDDTYPHTITLRVLLIHTEDTPAQQIGNALAAPSYSRLAMALG